MSSQVEITDNDRSPLISIVALVSMAATIIIVLVKLATKLFMSRHWEVDDYSAIAALLFAVGYTVAILVSAANGLGQHISTLDPDQIIRVQKAFYASEFTYGVTICLSKIPILYLLLCLSRKGYRYKVVFAVIILDVAWMIVTVLVIAFQCQLPDTWALFSRQCINMLAFWNAFGVIDIVIDFAITALPVYLLYDLHLKRSRKISVFIAFATRIMTVPLVIARLALLRYTYVSADRTFNATNTTIITIIHAGSSVIVACIPFFKPILESMSPGLFAGGLGTLLAIGRTTEDMSQLKDLSRTNPSLSSWSANVKNGLTTISSNKGRDNDLARKESTERMIIRQQIDVDVIETDFSLDVLPKTPA